MGFLLILPVTEAGIESIVREYAGYEERLSKGRLFRDKSEDEKAPGGAGMKVGIYISNRKSI